MRVWGPVVVCTVVSSAMLAALSHNLAAQGNPKVFIAKDTTPGGVAALGRSPHQIRGYTTQFAPEPLRLNIGNVQSPEQCVRIKVTFTALSGASPSGDVKSVDMLAHWDTSTMKPDAPGDSVVRCVATYLWRFGDSPGPQRLAVRLSSDREPGAPRISAAESYLEYKGVAHALPGPFVGEAWVGHNPGGKAIEAVYGLDFTPVLLLPFHGLPSWLDRIRAVGAVTGDAHDLFYGLQLNSLVLGPSAEGLPFQIAFGGRAGIAAGTHGGLFLSVYLSGSSIISTLTKGLGIGG
jgi:hypothetical protein